MAGYPGAAERGPTYAPAIYKAEHSDTAFVTDRAIDYIDARRDEPWFLHLVYLRPHPPFIAPEPYNRMYDPADVPGFRRAAKAEQEAMPAPSDAPPGKDAILRGNLIEFNEGFQNQNADAYKNLLNNDRQALPASQAY